jgi:hypothetical protein
LLAGADRRFGLTKALARCIDGGRAVSRVVHSLGSLLRQRIYYLFRNKG